MQNSALVIVPSSVEARRFMFQPKTAGQQGSSSLNGQILDQLTDSERATAVVYLDAQLRPPGKISIGGREYENHAPYAVAFIDQKPGANWMHPCRYLLIDPTTNKINSIESDRPPHFGALEPTWSIVWRSNGIDEWRLLPISRQSPEKPRKEEHL
jgi:hypothetical protein